MDPSWLAPSVVMETTLSASMVRTSPHFGHAMLIASGSFPVVVSATTVIWTPHLQRQPDSVRDIGSEYSGRLPRLGAYDLRRRASERIDHHKTAGAADIEMGVFFLCEVGASCENKDTQETNVASSRVRIV